MCSRSNRTAVLLLTFAAGCTAISDRPSDDSATPPGRVIMDHSHYAFDDVRFTADQRKAVRVATAAVLKNDSPSTESTRSLRFEATQTARGWTVYVVPAFQQDPENPVTSVGDCDEVTLNPDFTVVHISHIS